MKLLSWGANTYGQLGHGIKSEQCVLPIEVTTTKTPLNPADIISIVGGGGHSLILLKQGEVFGCGWNNRGQLGAPVCSEKLLLENISSLPQHIKQISCGWNSSMAVTKDGQLLAWGSNTYAQLGFAKSEVPLNEIPLKLAVPSIQQVACGLRHTAMLTSDGRVFVCGSGRKGQLGLASEDGQPIAEVEQPHEVPGLRGVKNVVCGQHHTIAQTVSGQIFVWGNNKYGQLALDPTVHPTVLTPFEIHPFEKETLTSDFTVLSGWTHACILTEKGQIINWGRNTYGQLGCHEFQRPVSWIPQLFKEVNRVKQMSVGSEHNIVMLDSGQVLSWGWNEHGNCGTGTENDVRTPTPVRLHDRAVLVGSGAGHSFAILDT